MILAGRTQGEFSKCCLHGSERLLSWVFVSCFQGSSVFTLLAGPPVLFFNNNMRVCVYIAAFLHLYLAFFKNPRQV